MRLALIAAALAAGPVWANGFLTRDLTDVDTSAFAAEVYDRSQEPDRLTLAPFEGEFMGEGFAAVDVQLARSTDGTEDRVRSGVTTMEDLAAVCEANAEGLGSDCGELQAAPLRGAVGWRTRTQAIGIELTTHVLIQGVDMLTIRAMGDDRTAVDALAALAFDALAPQIVAP